MRLEVIHSWDKTQTTFIALPNDRLGSPKTHLAEDFVPAWPYPGHCLLLWRTGWFDMRLAVPLVFHCHLHMAEIRSLTKRKLYLKQLATPGCTYCYRQQKQDRTKAWLFALTRWIHYLFDSGHLSKQKMTAYLPFSRNRFCVRIPEIIREPFSLTDERLVMTPHYFWQAAATRHLLLNLFSHDKLKDGSRWEYNTTSPSACKAQDRPLCK